MKKKSFLRRVGDFLMGRGFYMVLLLCVMAIGGSGYYLYHLASSSLDAVQQPVSGTAEVQVETQPVSPEVTVDITDAMREAEQQAQSAETQKPDEGSAAEEASATVEEPAAPSEAAEEEPAEETAAEVPVQETAGAAAFTAPVEGEAVAAFSDTELTYNAALGDWRTHNGVDLAANLGDEVHAAKDGEVLTISNDVLLGTTVTLNHGDGLMTVYGNLNPEVAVAQGDRVEAGQVIGTVGESANGEQNEGAWLHFAVQKDGKLVDPMEYLTES